MTDDFWPPREIDGDLAQIGRTVLQFNALEKHTSGVLRQFIIDDFSDRVVLGLCESLTGVELERNLLRFARSVSDDQKFDECEDAIRHLIKVYQCGKSLRNRIVHELSNSLVGNQMHLHKHVFTPDHQGKGLQLDGQILAMIVKWMTDASHYSAQVGIELSFVRGLRRASERAFISGDASKPGWPNPIELLPWDKIAVHQVSAD